MLNHGMIYKAMVFLYNLFFPDAHSEPVLCSVLCRGLMQAAEPLLAAKPENKLPNGVTRNQKEGGNMAMSEIRRSRSTRNF